MQRYSPWLIRRPGRRLPSLNAARHPTYLNHTSLRPRRGDSPNVPGPGPFQRFRARLKRSPGRHHIIDQQNPPPPNLPRIRRRKRSGHVGAPLVVRQTRLRFSRPSAPQQPTSRRNVGRSRHGRRQQPRLIEPPTPPPPAIKRYRDQIIDRLELLRRRRHQPPQPFRQRAHSVVLHQVDQSSQIPIICSETARTVK